jgi:PST family polysaccharide transporter
VADNKQILSLIRTVIGAISNVMLNFIFIPICGSVGASIATVVSYAIIHFLIDIFQRETKILFVMKVRSINVFSMIKRLK